MASEKQPEKQPRDEPFGLESRTTKACPFLRSATPTPTAEVSDLVSDGRETARVAGPLPLNKVAFTGGGD